MPLLRACLVAMFWLLAAFGLARAAEPTTLSNEGCLQCHTPKKPIEVEGADGDQRKLGAVERDAYAKGVHSGMQCVACHTNVVDSQAQHQLTGALKVDCAGCHEKLWEDTKAAGKAEARPRLGVVVENIEAYRKSFHVRKSKDDPTRPLADCHECHDTHAFNVPADRKSPAYVAWRREIPEKVCGTCHEDQIETYKESVHGVQIAEKTDGKAAICTDCHTTHEITNTSLVSFKLLVPEECGNCHEDNLETYRDTYHGQRSQLGDAQAAKCFDCHGSHEIKKVADKESMVHPDNRLETCQSCHDGKERPLATAGFVSFSPHAHGGDFERYPQMWVAEKFMVGLLIMVFAFFWSHCLLWYYREWMDRKRGVPRQFVHTAGLSLGETHHVQRFALGWRIGHLMFALVTMTLVLTGTSALYSGSGWAQAVAKAAGGAHSLGIIHRVAAALFVGIFTVHFLYVAYKLFVRDRKTFRWFGPDSLLPNWKDLHDVIGMFKWFVGKGPRPQFERWAYFEKFDYWAVFWGVNIIGWSGLMLALPHVTASFLPGWVFNVGTLVHGEEAFLAAVFLFTVHFFNNHFRPDKLPPPDVVMFTGSLSIEEFKRDHPAHYNRLVQTGELEKHLVKAPSRPMTIGSKILGLVLIACGLTLLALVAVGFFGGH